MPRYLKASQKAAIISGVESKLKSIVEQRYSDFIKSDGYQTFKNSIESEEDIFPRIKRIQLGIQESILHSCKDVQMKYGSLYSYTNKRIQDFEDLYQSVLNALMYEACPLLDSNKRHEVIKNQLLQLENQLEFITVDMVGSDVDGYIAECTEKILQNVLQDLMPS